jgi:hypothetical protein
MAEKMTFENGGMVIVEPNRIGFFCKDDVGTYVNSFNIDPIQLKKLGELMIRVANSSDLLWNGVHPVGQS